MKQNSRQRGRGHAGHLGPGLRWDHSAVVISEVFWALERDAGLVAFIVLTVSLLTGAVASWYQTFT